MSQQIQITGGAKVRDLQDVIIGSSGVLSSLGFDVANGVPRLDSNGKILVSQLPNSVMEYKGTWNAATNTPTLVNGTGNQGDVYLCNVAGTVNFGAGAIAFFVGDQVIYSGSIWQRASGASGTVTSVAITETGDSLNITGSPITTSGTINIGFNGTNLQYVNGAGNLTTFPTLITSIGLSMPSAFSVANSPLTANGTIAVTGAGYASQYIRGDGTLADFPSSGGGGSSVSYYLNGGTSQGTILGTTYYEMSKIADTGAMVDFTKSGDGFIVAFLTDANDPAQLNIPAGNWNYEIYASMSSNGGTPQLYAELYVYNGTTFTLISTSSNEILYDGTNLNLYSFAMTVPATTLALTDRLAIKLYATNSGGKTTTVHTQDSHLCQIITTFSTGITALNGLTAQVQYFQTGTSGTDFNISSITATHTFNLPTASASNRGALSSSDWSVFNGKQAALSGTGLVKSTSGTISYITDNSTNWDTAYTNRITSATSPLSITSNVISIAQSSSTVSGYLSSTDWNTFNNKMNSQSLTAGKVPFATGTSSLGDTVLNYNGGYFGFNTAANASYRIDVLGSINVTGDYYLNGVSITAGKVTSVTASSPLSSSGGTTPNITIALATTSASGYLSSTDWNTFNNKQAAIGYTPANDSLVVHLAGTETITGAKSFTGTATFSSTFTTTTNLTYSNSGFTLVLQPPTLSANKTITLPNTTGTLALLSDITSAVTSVTATSPLSSSGGYTPNITIAQATTSTSGYLSSTDWNTFNGKMNAASLTSGKMPFATGTSSLGDTVLSYNGGYFGFNTAANASYRIDVSGSVNVTGNYYINGVAISSGGIGGSGTTNYLSKFTASTTLGNSVIYDNGSSILIGTTDDGGKLVSYSTAGATQIKAAGVAPAITFSNTVLSPTIGAVVGAATSTNQFMTGTSAGDMIIACYFTGSIVFGTGSTTIERIRISSGGNLLLGIGTDAGYKLDVNGTGRFSGMLTAYTTTADATNNPGNSQIRASASSAKWLSVGYDPTINAGYLQGAESGISWRPIILNLNGTTTSPVLIGQSTSDGVSKLQVTGAATFSSTIQAGGNVTVSKAGDAQLIASTTDASGSGAYLNLTTPSHNWLIANNLANT